MPEPHIPARSIDEVLDRLDAEIERSVGARSRLAYFACLYRAVTQRVLDDIRGGRFQDARRMERLDVIFANRYLAAIAAHRAGLPATHSWQGAFRAARAPHLLILQHMLLGMNAHINLDLGIAAAETVPGAELPRLKRDFDEISRLLGEMLDDVQDRLTRVSPWLGLLDRVGGRSDEQICTFGLSGSRDFAWQAAQRFALVPKAQLPTAIDGLDRAVTLLMRPIVRPGTAVGAALLFIRAREPNDVAAVVRAFAT